MEALVDLLELSNSITDLPNEFFVDFEGRRLLYKGTVVKQVKGKVSTAKERQFFLFNDLLVYCEPKPISLDSSNGSSGATKTVVYQYKGQAYRQTSAIMDEAVSNTESNCFDLMLNKKWYFITAPSLDEKREWLRCLQLLYVVVALLEYLTL
jgi:hypothetical protein